MRPEVLQQIKASVSTNQVNLANLQINDAEIKEIMEEIKSLQPNLTLINLDGNLLGNEGALVLSQYLPYFHEMTELSLQFNNIGKEGAVPLFAVKRKLTDLDILFHGNLIIDEGEMDSIEKK